VVGQSTEAVYVPLLVNVVLGYGFVGGVLIDMLEIEVILSVQ